MDTELEAATRQRFLALLGEFTLNWNFSELWLRQLVQIKSAPSLAGWVLTVDLQASQLLNALKALATDFSEGQEQAHLLAFHDGLDALRVTRNTYIHGIARLSISPTWTASVVQSFTARNGRLKTFDLQIFPDDLKRAVTDSGAWAEYGRQLLECTVGLNPDGWSSLVAPTQHSAIPNTRRPLLTS